MDELILDFFGKITANETQWCVEVKFIYVVCKEILRFPSLIYPRNGDYMNVISAFKDDDFVFAIN